MKLIIWISLFLFSITLCSTKKQMETQVRKEQFMEKSGDRSKNWLELVYDRDSIRGVFYGFERLNGEKSIYYKSDMQLLVLEDGNIRFELRDYTVSEKPFEDDKLWEQYIVKDQSKVPTLLKFPQNFIGAKSSNDVKLRRTTMLFDSKFDELTLVRVNL
jgi:hypothetical protein